MATSEPPLDEIQWRSPQFVAEMGGIHSNTILHYFARSPFFEETSNNAILAAQALHNPHMFPLIQTREAFEGRLRTMAGLEFVVAQEPAEMGPGMGTGVWVIAKQTRRKRPGDVDDITVHRAYFVVGENIYQGPTMADALHSRIDTIASSIGKALPATEAVRIWTPSRGHTYQQPSSASARTKTATSIPDSKPEPTTKLSRLDKELQRLAEESFFRHLKYGNDYINEKPITGQPGNFHLSSTGRKDKAQGLKTLPGRSKAGVIDAVGGPAIDTKMSDEGKKDGKTEKSPRTPTTPKPRRRKSKVGVQQG